jgi:hypothetical protein
VDFAHSFGSVGCVMQHAVRIDQIERVVVELKLFRIRSFKVSLHAERFEARAGQFNCRFG